MMSKKVVICISAVAVVLIIVGIGIFATRQVADTPDHLLSLGEKYLTELNYEQALVQFLKVIEIDPMNPRGYTGAAEAYVGLGRTEDAVAILQQGLEHTGDDGIRSMLIDLGVDERSLDEITTYIDDSEAKSSSESPFGDITNLGLDFSCGWISDGRWPIGKDNKWGYADTSGNIVIPLIYDTAEAFNGGVAVVEKDGKLGLIDTAGNVVLPIEYDLGINFINGFAVVRRDEKEGLINKDGVIVIPVEYDWITYKGEFPLVVRKNEKSGIIDVNGGFILPLIYDSVSGFSEGYAAVTIEADDHIDNECGIVDTSGNFVLPLAKYGYYFTGTMHDGLIQANVRSIRSNGLSNWDSGYVDISGSVVLMVPFTQYGVISAYSRKDNSMGGFSGGLLAVFKGAGEAGFINKSGDVIIPYIYSIYDSTFNNDVVTVADVNGDIWKWGLINKSGSVVAPLEYDKLELINGSDAIYKAEKDGKFGLIKYTGEVLLPVEYDDFNFTYTGIYEQYEETTRVSKDGKYGIINNQGEWIIPPVYEYASNLQDGLAVVKKQGQYGVIDKSEDTVVPFGEYEFISLLGEGFALVTKNEVRGIIEVK